MADPVGRGRRAITVAAVLGALAVGPAACTRFELGCERTDQRLSVDRQTAREAVEVGAAAIGLDDVPTKVSTSSTQSSGPGSSGGNSYESVQFTRARLVDLGVDLAPAVDALEGEGFEVTGGTDQGTHAVRLERAHQWAKVEQALRMRDTAGMSWLSVTVSTGCRQR